MKLNINVMNNELTTQEALSIVNGDVFKRISLDAVIYDEDLEKEFIYNIGYDETTGIFGECRNGEYDDETYPDINTVLYCAESIKIKEMIYR